MLRHGFFTLPGSNVESRNSLLRLHFPLPYNISIHDLAHIHGMEVSVSHRITSIHILRICLFPDILRDFAQILILSVEDPALNRQWILFHAGSTDGLRVLQLEACILHFIDVMPGLPSADLVDRSVWFL